MARYRFALFVSFTALLTLVPSLTFAASFFGPVIPQSGACVCGDVFGALDWGCILQVVQNLVKLAVSLGVFLCVMWIAIAGFMLIASRGNPESISTARTRIMNAIVGIAVILCSWLIVDFVMKALYNQQNYGPWNAILAGTGDDYCIRKTKQEGISSDMLTNIVNSSGSSGADTGSPLTSSGTGACDASIVQQGASSGGYSLTNQQASQLACIAKHESGCGTSRGVGNPNYSWNKANSEGKASTAAGPYQVLLRTNYECYQNPACTTAAGGQSLNCKNAFNSDGFITDSSLAQKCLVMAGNTACSASAAACQLKRQSFTSMYAADPDVGKCASGG